MKNISAHLPDDEGICASGVAAPPREALTAQEIRSVHKTLARLAPAAGQVLDAYAAARPEPAVDRFADALQELSLD